MSRLFLFDPDTGTSLVSAPGRGAGWWAGAPSRAEWRGLSLLSYRLRAPTPRRGFAVRIARLDGYRVVDLTEITASQLASPSLERACLVARGDRLDLYLSSVDGRDGRWRIDVLTTTDATTFDPMSPRTVLTAASTGTEGVKDPVIVASGDGLVMFASAALRSAVPDHASGDIFGTGTVRSATGIAQGREGEAWAWQGPVLEPSGDGWDAYETRISCLLAPDLALYDGLTRAEDNYRERTGVARRDSDGSWRSVTPRAPVLDARYVAFDGERYFWEHELADGSHELRVAAPSTTLDAATLG